MFEQRFAASVSRWLSGRQSFAMRSTRALHYELPDKSCVPDCENSTMLGVARFQCSFADLIRHDLLCEPLNPAFLCGALDGFAVIVCANPSHSVVDGYACQHRHASQHRTCPAKAPHAATSIRSPALARLKAATIDRAAWMGSVGRPKSAHAITCASHVVATRRPCKGRSPCQGLSLAAPLGSARSQPFRQESIPS